MLNHKGTRPLETERLHLRRFVLSDEEAVYNNWASSPEAARYLTWRAHSTRKITHDVLEGWCRHYGPKVYRWAIVWRETGELIGSVDIVRTDEEASAGELGYVLSPRFWRRGIVPEAVAALARYCFEEVGYQRLIGEFDERNPASGRVMEKLGMRYVKTITGKYQANTGEPCTVRHYELSREEWAARKFRRAYSHDVFAVSRLYEDLADALPERGGPGPGWIKGVYPCAATAQEAYARGELYVAVEAGKLVGTMILNSRQEAAYQGASWRYPCEPGQALVIHTLAVHPMAGGRGVGRGMLAYAEKVARERHCPVVRMDTHIDNTPAIQLYEACGFRRADRIDLGIGETFGLYWFYTFEKQL